MNSVTDIVEVYDLLYRLGFSATNTAFFHLSYSVYLASLNPHWLVKPSQRLYPEVADQYNTNPLQVVRNIDGFACASWHKNAAFLRSLTCCPLMAAPTAAQFCGCLCTMSGRDLYSACCCGMYTTFNCFLSLAAGAHRIFRRSANSLLQYFVVVV